MADETPRRRRGRPSNAEKEALQQSAGGNTLTAVTPAPANVDAASWLAGLDAQIPIPSFDAEQEQVTEADVQRHMPGAISTVELDAALGGLPPARVPGSQAQPTAPVQASPELAKIDQTVSVIAAAVQHALLTLNALTKSMADVVRIQTILLQGNEDATHQFSNLIQRIDGLQESLDGDDDSDPETQAPTPAKLTAVPSPAPAASNGSGIPKEIFQALGAAIQGSNGKSGLAIGTTYLFNQLVNICKANVLPNSDLALIEKALRAVPASILRIEGVGAQATVTRLA